MVIGLFAIFLRTSGFVVISILGVISLLLGSYFLCLYMFGFFCLRPKYRDYVWSHAFREVNIPDLPHVLVVGAMDGGDVFYFIEQYTHPALIVGHHDYNSNSKYLNNVLHNIEALSEKSQYYPYFVSGAETCLPFKNNSFDLVLVSHRIRRKDLRDGFSLTLSEFKRVLKPVGGLIVFESVRGYMEAFQRSALVFMAFLPPVPLIKKLKLMGFTAVTYHNYSALRYITAKALLP